ncbi:MAG: hypothetical protein DWQ05_14790 [Calditrichaeota bacterium]|nr:MAG: hypothetical protein DWQ05_14790 [Calditrichota bacterium]
MKKRIAILWIFVMFFGANSSFAQTSYPWPVTPFDASHEISGTFCEYRDTGDADHFHNGVDIPKVDGSPVYPVNDAVISSLERNGSNAYVRAGRYAYVHISPSPSLAIGDSVFASTTVLGTILSGSGHLHLNDGYYNSETNALRSGGGLTPFDDPWPPIISDIRFFLLDTKTTLPASGLSGKVRITFRVQEQNGPPGASASRMNNGAYWVGYKILSTDREEIIFSPETNGIQFKFDNKPSNSFVHNVFDKNQATLSNHVYNITNQLTQPDYWDTEALPEGNYTVMLFAGDTRGNSDTAYVDVTTTRLDLIPPGQPTLFTAIFTEDSLSFNWSSVADSDLLGYQLWSSKNNMQWQIAADKYEIKSTQTAFALPTQDSLINYYRVTAVDTTDPGNESLHSDIYAAAIDPAGHRILIVDGFDRTQSSGSYHEKWHPFAATHGRAIAANGFGFETCSNETISDGQLSLIDYDAVFWVLGDESTTDQTFTTTEQTRIRQFLSGGGFLFVSGSEIAWDLGAKGTSTDKNFMRNYLKIDYESDDSNSYSVKGVAGSLFQGLNISYGISTSPYPEDYPDTFYLSGGSEAVLRYSTNKIAGILYEGLFGSGTTMGKLIVLAFPFETITTSSSQNNVMGRVLNYFFPQPSSVEHHASTVAQPYYLSQNYPNPFNPKSGLSHFNRTQIEFTIARKAIVKFKIYDILGRTIKTWQADKRDTGAYSLAWDGRNNLGSQVAAGVYFWEMTISSIENVKNILQRNHIKIMVQ